MVYGNVPDHIKAPEGIELKPSKVDRRLTGAWCTADVKQGSLFGPFKGEIVKENERKKIDFRYAWEVYDLDTSELIHIINATDPSKGDWTRYVNCARYLEEQNLVSVQEGSQVFYKAIRDIPSGEELLTWFERSKIKRNSSIDNKEEKPQKGTPSPKKKTTKRSRSDSSLGLGDNVTIGEKRQRKKKKMFGDVEEVSLAELIPKKRTKRSVDSKDTSTEDPSTEAITTQIFNSLDVDTIKVYCNSTSSTGAMLLESDKRKLKQIEDEWSYPPKWREYQFGFLNRITTSVNNRRMYKCNICGGLYRHKFSLKRHYLRNHINCQYLSKAAITNCMISVSSQYLAMVEENGEEAVSKIQNQILNSTNEHHTNLNDKSDDFTSDTNDDDSLNDTASNADECPEETGVPVNPDEKYTETGLFPGLYRCNACNRLFDKAPELADHLKEHSEIPDAKMFACTLCNMTFKFKMNLVRHQLVHEGKTSGSMGTSKEKIKVEPANDSGDPNRPFMCSQCPMKFKYSTNLVKHEIVHSDDRPCKCSVCDKSFPSTTNLKKHMNIHTGCKVPCKYCEAVFSHVGALRKHIRLLHPTIHRERLLKLLERQGKLGSKAQKYLDSSYESEHSNRSSERGSTYSSSNEGEKEVKPKKEKKTKTRIEDGIDSRFKFSCTICKKRFTEYVNMCRHRRMAHEEPESENNSNANSEGSLESGNAVEENPEVIAAFFANVAYNIAENLTCYLDGGQEALEAHRKREDEEVEEENVEKDKKVEDPPHIALDQYNFPHSYNPRLLQENFEYCPLDPSELMKKYEKEVPNYFDVNIDESSLDDRGPALCTRRRNSKDSKDDSRDSIWGNRFDGSFSNSPAKSERSESPMLKIGCVFSGKEAALLIPDTPKKESSEGEGQDSKMITIDPLEVNAVSMEKTEGKPVDNSSEGKAKHGTEVMQEESNNKKEKESENTGTKDDLMESQEGPDPSSEQEGEENSEEQTIEKKDIQQSPVLQSTPEKTENQDSGDNHSSPGDINGNRKQVSEALESEKSSTTERKEEGSEDGEGTKESEHTPRKHIFKIMEYSKLKKGNLTVIRHGELEQVKDSSSVEKGNMNTESQKSEALASPTTNKENCISSESVPSEKAGSESNNKVPINDMSSDDSNSGILLVDLFTDSDSEQTSRDHELMLQGLDLARGAKDKTEERKARSSSLGNSPQRSPLYNYETIMFGKLGDTAYVCSVCKRHYPDFDRLVRHQWKKHPSIYCDFMEVEQGHEIESLYYSKPCHRGLLGSSGKALERAIHRPSYTCTRCRGSFKSVDRLRVHIINCATPQPSPTKKKKSYYKRKTPIKLENGETESPSKLASQVNVKELNSKMKELSSKSDKKADNVVREKTLNGEEVKSVDGSKTVDTPKSPTKSPTQKDASEVRTLSANKASPEKKESREDSEKAEASRTEQKTTKSPSVKAGSRKNMVEKEIQTAVKGNNTSERKSKGKVTRKTEQRKSPVKVKSEPSRGGIVTECGQRKKMRRGRDFVIYNPRNHIRRRELSEVLDKQQCKGCGVKFKTISLLERHVKKCDEKDKFKEIKMIKSNVNEAFHQKQRHMCFYCNKGFIYPKSLMNHFKAFCIVKKDRESSGGLSEEDKSTEATMMKRLIQQEEDRKITNEDCDATDRKKGGWPRGKKRKKHRRKNHSWTIIKQRKSSSNGQDLSAASDFMEEAEEMETLEDEEESLQGMSESEQTQNTNVKSNKSKKPKLTAKSPQKSGSKKESGTSSTIGPVEVPTEDSKIMKEKERTEKKSEGLTLVAAPKEKRKSDVLAKGDGKKIQASPPAEEKQETEPPRKRGRKKTVKTESEDTSKNPEEEVKAKKSKLEDSPTASDVSPNNEVKTTKRTSSAKDVEGKSKKSNTGQEEGSPPKETNVVGKPKKGKLSYDNPDMKFVTMKNIVKRGGGGGGSPVKTVEREVEEEAEKVTANKLTFHIYDSNSFKKKKTVAASGPGVVEKKFHIIQPGDFTGRGQTEGEGGARQSGDKGKKAGEGEKEAQVGEVKKGQVAEGRGHGGVDTKEGGGKSVEKKSNKIKGVVNKKPDTLQFHQVDVAAMKSKKGSRGVKKK